MPLLRFYIDCQPYYGWVILMWLLLSWWLTLINPMLLTQVLISNVVPKLNLTSF